MKLKRIEVLVCFMLAISNTACQKPVVETDVIRFEKLAAVFLNFEQVKFYEGLPHQMFEKEALASEVETKRCREIDGHQFYDQAFSVRPIDLAEIRNCFAEVGNFRLIEGAKSCGGYHPDYLIEWSDGAASYRTGICFGCGELELRSKEVAFRIEFTEQAEARLEDILEHYWQERPVIESSYIRFLKKDLDFYQSHLEEEELKGTTGESVGAYREVVAYYEKVLREEIAADEQKRPAQVERGQSDVTSRLPDG